ncbi:MAG: DUF2436 domain-containing protein [Bacteroidales bacterium]|nr:DUF2436 domain-containing protein [Bacteroidales bacterium]
MKKVLSFVAILFAVVAVNAQNATIVLTAGDVWSDGTGYQVLIDADNVLWGDSHGPACGSVYTDWEYMIPSNASADDAAVVVDATQSIQIPAGTYAYLVLNPGCNDYNTNYIASSQCDQTNASDYLFEAGKTYTFEPVLGGPNSANNDCVTITISTTSAIPENGMPTLSIFPNPATTVLNVEAEGYSNVQLVNVLGQVVYSANVTSNMQINVSNLDNGVYFVRVAGENGTTTQKFIKK